MYYTNSIKPRVLCLFPINDVRFKYLQHKIFAVTHHTLTIFKYKEISQILEGETLLEEYSRSHSTWLPSHLAGNF